MSINKTRKILDYTTASSVEYVPLVKANYLSNTFRVAVVPTGLDANYTVSVLQRFLTATETIEDPILNENNLFSVVDADNNQIEFKNLTEKISFNGNNLEGGYLVVKIETLTTTGTIDVYAETDVQSTYNEE
jgi:hypothetical protein